MAGEADVRKLGEEASALYSRILDGLQEYYGSDVTFGLVAEKIRMSVRGLIEFMQRYRLPYKGGEGDREKGLALIAKLRQDGKK